MCFKQLLVNVIFFKRLLVNGSALDGCWLTGWMYGDTNMIFQGTWSFQAA
ncbi:MAG: hypothetical protein HF976_14580 [ANME-2 cluster archaeon]|nr:hypothetical protein [ANME-2 cluster archaeon]